MPKHISDIEFTVFDLETTGLEAAAGDRIVEVAAIRLKNNEKIGTFHSLINPGEKIVSPEAFAVNHISQEMLSQAPPIEQVLPEFLHFLSGSCLAAYNARFDFAFLSSESRLVNRQLPEGLQIIDILIMAKRVLFGLERYTLECVARALGISSLQEHRALSDAQITAEVFNRLNFMLIKKGIVDFEHFISLFGLSSRLLDDINNAKIAQIQRALDLKVSLKIKYLTRYNAEVTEREVIPRAITQEKNRRYLVGYCNLRREERTFRIDNILHLEIGP